MGAQPLTDSYGRVHRDLRISVTDRCNFRCTYCMPEEGMRWMPRADLLTYEEIVQVARVFVDRFGFESIRLTGGEPTVRSHLPILIEKLAALPVDLSLTTNGATLDSVADDLAAAGLKRVNVSLDSLRRDRFHAMTKRDELYRVLAGIASAQRAGLRPVKVNCVVMRGVNDDEIVDFARFGRENDVAVRFIEFMPLDAQGSWRDDQVVSQNEILAAVDAAFPIEPVAVRGAEPAERFRYRDGLGEVGVIPSVTNAFCDACDRVRLTAEGQLRSCLFALDETDLRTPLRTGADDDALAELISANVASKWAGHRINQPVFVRPTRSMSQIGG
jgi:cyclic pyranopterin phosphate synthase